MPAMALWAMIGGEFEFGLHNGLFFYHLLGIDKRSVAVFTTTRFWGVKVLRYGLASSRHVLQFTP